MSEKGQIFLVIQILHRWKKVSNRNSYSNLVHEIAKFYFIMNYYPTTQCSRALLWFNHILMICKECLGGCGTAEIISNFISTITVVYQTINQYFQFIFNGISTKIQILKNRKLKKNIIAIGKVTLKRYRGHNRKRSERNQV